MIKDIQLLKSYNKIWKKKRKINEKTLTLKLLTVMVMINT